MAPSNSSNLIPCWLWSMLTKQLKLQSSRQLNVNENICLRTWQGWKIYDHGQMTLVRRNNSSKCNAIKKAPKNKGYDFFRRMDLTSLLHKQVSNRQEGTMVMMWGAFVVPDEISVIHGITRYRTWVRCRISWFSISTTTCIMI